MTEDRGTGAGEGQAADHHGGNRHAGSARQGNPSGEPAAHGVPPDGFDEILDSYVVGTGERAAVSDLDRLRPGTPLLLRRASQPVCGRNIEVLTLDGRPLGWLPSEDGVAVPLDRGTVFARVTGVLPGFQRSRIQLRVAIPARLPQDAC